MCTPCYLHKEVLESTQQIYSPSNKWYGTTKWVNEKGFSSMIILKAKFKNTLDVVKDDIQLYINKIN